MRITDSGRIPTDVCAQWTAETNQNVIRSEIVIMKTLQNFYKEIIADEELKKAFTAAAKENKVV